MGASLTINRPVIRPGKEKPMKKLAWLFAAMFFVLGCASSPVVSASAKPAEPYIEKSDYQSEALIFPEAIVMYSIKTFYNNRMTADCPSDLRMTLKIEKEMSQLDERMVLRCPNGAEAGRELHAIIVGARSDDPTNNPARFIAFVEASERIKMMTVTQLLLVYLADRLESLARYEFAPYVCPSPDTVEFDFNLNPSDGMVQLLADRLATTRLTDNSRYLKYDEVVAAWDVTRKMVAFRAGCLPDTQIEEVLIQFQALLNHLYPTQ